jgi:hypothetical protein
VSAIDLLIRGDEADVAGADGRIVAVGPELAGPAAEEIDARGLLVLPGALARVVRVSRAVLRGAYCCIEGRKRARARPLAVVPVSELPGIGVGFR